METSLSYDQTLFCISQQVPLPPSIFPSSLFSGNLEGSCQKPLDLEVYDI